MMDFIMVPAIMAIITVGIYKLFELFVCKKERLMLIEKWEINMNRIWHLYRDFTIIILFGVEDRMSSAGYGVRSVDRFYYLYFIGSRIFG